MREYDDESILCVANLSRSAQPVELDLSRFRSRVPIEMLGRTAFPPIGDLPYLLTLPGHDFYWFRLAVQAEAPAWHVEALPPMELPMLVLFDGWRSFVSEQPEPRRVVMAKKLRGQLEREILPEYLLTQRWFAAKAEPLERVEIKQLITRPQENHAWLWLWVKVYFAQERTQVYFLPLSIGWGETDDEQIRALLPVALAKIRQQARVGIIYDALYDEAFSRAIVKAMSESSELSADPGMLRFCATSAYFRLVDEEGLKDLRRPSAEGTNSAVVLNDQLFLKLYRQIQAGLNLEMEMGRFLTEVSPYPNISPLIGAIEYQESDGISTTLVLVQAYQPNQGDGWNYTIDYLLRFFEDCLTNPAIVTETPDWHADYQRMMHILGLRTGELHKALTFQSGNPAFDPEPILPEDLRVWRDQVCRDTHSTLEKLEDFHTDISENSQNAVHQLLQEKEALLDRIARITPGKLDAVKTRYHGDYHLGQVLLNGNDFVIIDFEGEPARPLGERRSKHSPLRDVAGMLRSFNYARAVALASCTAERPADYDRLLPYAQDWEAGAANAFLSGYREGAIDCPAWPRVGKEAEQLIELFVLEKALYELRYELDHRMEWVGIPLAGLLAILKKPLENIEE